MPLDNAQFISELSITDPSGTDPLSEGDDQIRTIKRATQQSFPNIDAQVTLTAAQFNDVALKSEAQSISGQWAFTLAPIMPGINAETDFTLRVAGTVALENALIAIANGPVSLFHDNIQRLATGPGGITDLFSDGNTDTESRRLIFRHQDTTIRAFVGHASADIFDVENQIPGGNIRLVATDAGAVGRVIVDGNPDSITTLRAATNVEIEVANGDSSIRAIANGPVQLFSNNIRRFDAEAGGQISLRSDGSTDTENRLINFLHQNGASRGFIGYAGSGVFQIQNSVPSGKITLFATNAGAANRISLDADPDAITILRAATSLRLEVANGELALFGEPNAETQLYFNNIKTMQTALAASGGLLVDNQATGAGLERVLTESDLVSAADPLFALFITGIGTAGVVIAAASGVASTWTVADGDQAGESVITHNLGLSSSNNLVITATADHGIDPGIDEIFCYIENRGINSFQIQMMDGPVAVDGHDVNIICSLVAA